MSKKLLSLGALVIAVASLPAVSHAGIATVPCLSNPMFTPNPAAPGAPVRLTGDDVAPNTSVETALEWVRGDMVYRTVTADSTGAFTLDLAAPDQAGQYAMSITASCPDGAAAETETRNVVLVVESEPAPPSSACPDITITPAAITVDSVFVVSGTGARPFTVVWAYLDLAYSRSLFRADMSDARGAFELAFRAPFQGTYTLSVEVQCPGKPLSSTDTWVGALEFGPATGQPAPDPPGMPVATYQWVAPSMSLFTFVAGGFGLLSNVDYYSVEVSTLDRLSGQWSPPEISIEMGPVVVVPIDGTARVRAQAHNEVAASQWSPVVTTKPAGSEYFADLLATMGG